MAASARVFASLPNKQHQRLSQLADAKGLSISRLLAGLVERELAENPEERVQRLIAQAQDDRAPAEKYTVRLMGIDAILKLDQINRPSYPILNVPVAGIKQRRA